MHQMMNYGICLKDLVPFTKNFRWKEFLYLPQWDVYVFPNLVLYDNLIRIGIKLQEIRNDLQKPIKITSGLRPKLYNKKILGATRSQHMYGSALDFVVKDYEDVAGCNILRRHLEPKLEGLNIRMEDKADAAWLHIDNLQTSGKRFFRP